MFYVYELLDPKGVTFYVGKGQGSRMRDHQAEALTGKRSHKCNKIRKILADGGQISPVIVFQTEKESEAHSKEISLIAIYGRDNLTNCTDGGEGVTGMKHSAETKRRLGEMNKLRGPVSTETRRRMSESQTGIPHGPFTVEHKAKLAAAKLGTRRSEETKAKIAATQRTIKKPWARAIALENLKKITSFKGKKHTPESIQKIRDAKMGHIVTQSTRDKISASKKGSIPWNKNQQKQQS